ncbi:hypothetical protein DZ956_022385 [Pseudomonas aeruginosa]|uniref:hypothetical protein n=1 Tax=Pseudomonas aeruginosa TaxID=287 RepID=UPI000E31A3A1|nr:hypothetical protein [Pseudomonas aeruginosa]NPZ19526.1 hypothetical protein [Pseudomonas aeruginosa]
MTQGTAPTQFVTPERIRALTDSLRYDVHHVPGTKVVVVSATLPGGFLVSTVSQSPVPGEPFDLGRVTQAAKATCLVDSRARLWDLEAYMLTQTLESLRALNAADALVEIRATLEKRCAAITGVDSECACIGPCQEWPALCPGAV